MKPRHVNPDALERTAMAPYNFIPLPNQALSVSDGIEIDGEKIKPWMMHDKFIPGTYSGWIDLEIVPKTPLFIRGPATKKNGKWETRESRLRPEPFKTPDDTKPMIPGSSLRGMIRTLVEILSFSKIQPVTKEKPFYRSVGRGRIGKVYRGRMVQGNLKPVGGYICINDDRWTIVPAREVLRVHRDILNGLQLEIPIRQNPKYHPSWKGQHKNCWFKRDPNDEMNVVELSLTPKSDDWEQGILVLTGTAPEKKREFVFVGRDERNPIDIPDTILWRFHDEDQISSWQRDAFPRDRPQKGSRRADGYLRDREPVFYLCFDSSQSGSNPMGLVFLGRAQMFRFPYDKSPLDLVPGRNRDAGIDMSEAIFGIVPRDKNDPSPAIKGRVYFEDAPAIEVRDDCYDETLVPEILSSPKITCFQHYLTQYGSLDSEKQTTYIDGDKTTIRGHKLYWHRWDEKQHLEAVKEENQEELLPDLQSEDPKDKQHTIIKPIKANSVTFKGRIRFENLANVELGVLLCALELTDDCAHKLGMGKPLGLGSVVINIKLNLIDRQKRYQSWSESGETTDDSRKFVEEFQKKILEHAQQTREPTVDQKQGLRRIARLDAFFHMLSWDKKPTFESTRYMTIEGGDAMRFPVDKGGKVNEYQKRPVLPTPHNVVGESEPDWTGEMPRAGKLITEKNNQTAGNSLKSPLAYLEKLHLPPVPPPPPRKKTDRPIGKGQTRSGILKRYEDSWIAIFEGDERQASIKNESDIPPNTEDNARAEFLILVQSKREGIKIRFLKLL